MNVRRATVVVSLLMAGVVGCALTRKAPARRFQGEAVPVFRARDVLPNEILRGSNYFIADHVPVEQYANVFTIHSARMTLVEMGPVNWQPGP